MKRVTPLDDWSKKQLLEAWREGPRDRRTEAAMSGGRISWSREDREKAKKEKKYLFALAIDGGELDGSIFFRGVCTKEEAREIRDLINKMIKEET